VAVAVGRPDLDNAVAHVEQRDVEGAPAEVEDEDRLLALLVWSGSNSLSKPRDSTSTARVKRVPPGTS
jgi:hypothetical protein